MRITIRKMRKTTPHEIEDFVEQALAGVLAAGPAVVAGQDGMLHGDDLRYGDPVIPSRLDRKTLAISGGHHLRDDEVNRMLRTYRSAHARTLVLAGILLSTLFAAPTVASAETLLGCGSRQNFSVTEHPRTCFLDWPDLPLAGAINLQRIHWHSWGGSVAPGRAVWRTKTYDPWSHVTILAYRRRSCGTGALYTRVRVTGTDTNGKRWSHSWRTMHCSDLPGDR
ncbi:MAG: hypothetical protein JWM47_4560 [Acidimicrobiales bacterium]|nr:hypothetical protein [Acidimicrobiales bacterium]